MPHAHRRARQARRARRAVTCAAVVGTVAALTLTGAPRTAAAPLSPTGPGDLHRASGQRERKGDYDARTASAQQQVQAERSLSGARRTANRALGAELGAQGLQQTDAVTGTPRMVGRLDGFLTKRSKKPATTIVLAYVRAHLTAFGLTKADLSTFVLTRRYVDIAGIQHLSWRQTADGVSLFGNGLKANVTKHGELISIQGSPVSGLAAQAAAAGSQPGLTASQARTKAVQDVGGTTAEATARTTKAGRLVTWANADRAQLVWFSSSNGLRLAWSTYVQAGSNLNYQHVIDADSGRVLYRHDTVDEDQNTQSEPTPGGEPTTPSTGADSSAPVASATTPTANKGRALVYNNYPGAPKGGKQQVYNLVTHKLLSSSATTLSGYYVNAFADVNDNNVEDAGESVPVPGTATTAAQYKLTSFNAVNPLCSSKFICTWDPSRAGSWSVNERADVTQGFYFDSIYHHYLLAKPFGFTRSAGNFEARDGDAVQLNSLDGANTAAGLPDGNHIDNANMNTPPNGIAPTMQMYLFHAPGASNSQDPFLPGSSSFDSSVILHEYTHGLSNRLVVDATGNSTLNSLQAGSMGEAWSDYYALDYLVNHKLEVDTPKSGQVVEGRYVDAGTTIRTMAIDCPVKTSAAGCTRLSGKRGGYTYGQLSAVIGEPEVHASGEIWSQTLWDLRGRLGHTVTGMLTTRAMELSPADPSFLDMRNAIIEADRAVYGGKHVKTIWSVFAKRGMGYFAGSLDSGDTAPAQSFATPPKKGAPKGTFSGRVVEGLTGSPVARALVSVTGHDSGFAGSARALTDATGRFTIRNLPVGTYPKVVVLGPGHEALSAKVTVRKAGTKTTFRPRRDWAASTGGGQVASFNGPDLSAYGCGPAQAIDLRSGTGWGSTTGNDNGDPTNVMIPKKVVVHLPAAISLKAFAVDPSNTCGDPGSAATGQYRIETSPNGTTWTQAAAGTFTSANRGHLNPVPAAAATGVSYVRFTMLSPQVPDFATNCPAGAYTGCSFTDLTELEVFGTR